MSPQTANELGPNAIMCYFPWFPYYQRYQIGFDILVNSPNAQADPSVAGQSQRLIHVRLYFPDGFICNPANFSGLPHPPSFKIDPQHFLPPCPYTDPPNYHAYTSTSSHFHHHVPVGFPGPMTRQEQHDARVIVYVGNGQPAEFMVIDDTPYDIIPQCKGCGEFHGDHIHNKPLQGVPIGKSSQESNKRPSHQHPSAAARERATIDPKNRLRKEDKSNLTQQMAGQHQHGTHEIVQGIQRINDIVTSACNQPTTTTTTITYKTSCLDISSQNNEGNVAQDNKKPDADPKVDAAQDNEEPIADTEDEWVDFPHFYYL